MKHYNSYNDAMSDIEKARKEMAFSERDKFTIIMWGPITDGEKRFSIQMHSADSNHFCGYY